MNVPEFRKNMREAFNAAEHGEVVRIERFGKTFILRCKEALPNIPDYRQEYTPPPEPLDVRGIEVGKEPTLGKISRLATPTHEQVKGWYQDGDLKKPLKPEVVKAAVKQPTVCREHLVDKSICKLMKHTGKDNLR